MPQAGSPGPSAPARSLMRYRAAYIAGALAIPLAFPVPGAGAASPAPAGAHVRAVQEQDAGARAKRAERRRRIRRQLAREVRRNPRVVMTKRFIRKAGHVRFDLPLTVRLSPLIDDAVIFAIPPVSAASDYTFDYTTDGSPFADPAGSLTPIACP